MFKDFAGKDATCIYDEAEHPKWVDMQLDFYLVGVLKEEDEEIKQEKVGGKRGESLST